MKINAEHEVMTEAENGVITAARQGTSRPDGHHLEAGRRQGRLRESVVLPASDIRILAARIIICSFKPSSVWHFVLTTLGN